MRFYLGTHETSWLWKDELREIPLFISYTRLRRRVALRPATTRWVLDSGGFSEIKKHGKWTVTPEQYIEATRRYVSEIGSLDWAAPQDWMCEPVMTARTGLTVTEHQHRTVENYLTLRQLAPDLPFMPILQGWTMADYIRCIQLYDRAGVDLGASQVVGVGSVCKRQHTEEIGGIFRLLQFEGLNSLHGFGVKSAGIQKYGRYMSSADSMSWSFDGRYAKNRPPSCLRKNCANCLHHALSWRERVLKAIESLEYGIQMEDGYVIVGPHWGSPADVMDSFHAFGTNRAYGRLVVRSLDPRPESHRDPVTGDIDVPGAPLPEWRLADGHV